MAILLVTYDLNKEPDSDGYKEILKIIKEGGSWARLSESSYAIETNSTPFQVYNKLKPHLDNNDKLVVITLHKPYYGQHDTKVIEWLDAKLKPCPT